MHATRAEPPTWPRLEKYPREAARRCRATSTGEGGAGCLSIISALRPVFDVDGFAILHFDGLIISRALQLQRVLLVVCEKTGSQDCVSIFLSIYESMEVT